jgi:heptosyltransferase-3
MNWKLIRIIDAYAGIPLVYVLAGLRRLFFRPERPSSARRLLLVKFWGIGNLFMMLPSVAALRKAFPGAAIDLLTLASSRQAAESTGAFDGIRTVDTRGFIGFLRTTIAAVGALRRRHYDVIVDFEQFARFSALCIAAAGAARTIGFRTRGQHRHVVFTHPVSYNNTVHITRSYCSLAEAAGAPAGTCDPRDLSLPGDDGADERAAAVRSRLGMGSGPYVIFHVGTSDNFRERRWPAAGYAALADRMAERADLRIVLTGLAEEGFIAAEIAGLVRARDRLVDASGRISFPEYFDLIRSSKLVVSADTAAVHIASALGVPVVGLYGPNTPQLYGPWGEGGVAVYGRLSCSPCITNFNAKTHNCRHPGGKGACMRSMDAQDVYRSIEEHFGDLFSSPALPGRTKTGEPCSR